MPILDDRPCAKKLFDRKALVTLQTDPYKEVGRHWGLERGQEGSQAEHLDTVEFKLKKMQEAAVTAQRQADAAEERTLLADKTPRSPNSGKPTRSNARQTFLSGRSVWSAKSPLCKPPRKPCGNMRSNRSVWSAKSLLCKSPRKPCGNMRTAQESQTRRTSPHWPRSSPRQRRSCNTARRISTGSFRNCSRRRGKTRNCKEAPTFCGRSGGTRPKNSMRQLRRSTNEKPLNALRPSNRRTTNGANEKQQEERISDSE